MRKIILTLIFLINFSIISAQNSYEIKSKDGKVIAENFISYDEGRDSVIVKNEKCKLKFSHYNPLFSFIDDDGYSPVDPSFFAHYIKKIKDKVYMVIGVGGDTSLGTELNLIFIKKNKILKYYIVVSNNKRLRDVTFEYLPKTKEVIIPITKQYTPQNFIYEINLKENKLDTIKPLKEKTENKHFRYKLKIK